MLYNYTLVKNGDKNAASTLSGFLEVMLTHLNVENDIKD